MSYSSTKSAFVNKVTSGTPGHITADILSSLLTAMTDALNSELTTEINGKVATGATLEALTNGNGYVRMTDAERTKLTSLSANYRGNYSSLSALVSTIPSASAGDWAILTNGGGGNASIALWDSDESTPAWIEVGELASDAEVRSAATGGKLLQASHLESASAIVTLTDAATVAVDWDTFINGTVTLGGNRTLGNPTNGQPGTWRQIIVNQDGTGNRTLSFAANYEFVGGTAPTLSTGADEKDILNIFCETASVFHVYSALDMS